MDANGERVGEIIQRICGMSNSYAILTRIATANVVLVSEKIFNDIVEHAPVQMLYAVRGSRVVKLLNNIYIFKCPAVYDMHAMYIPHVDVDRILEMIDTDRLRIKTEIFEADELYPVQLGSEVAYVTKEELDEMKKTYIKDKNNERYSNNS